MGTLAQSSWLSLALRLLPKSWLAALDAWSLRLAHRQLAKRRAAVQAPPAQAPIEYKLRHWRD